jgi:hypothetical protein
MTSRLIIRLISDFKHSHFSYDSPSTSNDKICRAFVISSNQYGSFRPTYIPSPLLYRSDSLFSNNEFLLNRPQIPRQQSLHTISTSKTNNTSLLEHYLKTYNPLKIDLTNINDGTVRTSIVKDTSYEEAPSDSDTRPRTNCYALNCTNKQKLYHGERYTRLREEENCSATRSITDDRLSDCSTKLTSITLPMLMVTDCSDSQRLHTDIIELNDDEKDK